MRRLFRAVRRFLAGTTETPSEVAAAVDDVHRRIGEAHDRFRTSPD